MENEKLVNKLYQSSLDETLNITKKTFGLLMNIMNNEVTNGNNIYMYKFFVIIKEYLKHKKNFNYVVKYIINEKISKMFMKQILEFMSIIKKIVYNRDFILLCIQNLDFKFYYDIDFIIDNIIKMNDVTLTYKLIEHLKYCKLSIKCIDFMKIPINNNVLEFICTIDGYDNTKSIYDIINRKIVPTKKCFNYIVIMASTIYKTFDKQNLYINDIINIFVRGGYELSSSDIYVLLDRGYFILH